MVVTCEQMQALEAAAFARGILAEDLMQEAGEGIAAVVRERFGYRGVLVLALGKGNNAGDALVAAQILVNEGWHLVVRWGCEVETLKPLPAKHWALLEERHGHAVRVVDSLEEVMRLHFWGPVVVLDGLVGIGASKGLRGPLAEVAREVNVLRKERHAAVLAVDLPSGLDAVTGEPGEGCIEADVTVTIAHVKRPLLADAAVNHVGRLMVVPLRELQGDVMAEQEEEVLLPGNLRRRLPRRRFDVHKGNAGRVGLVAGSRGFLGAGVLCALGALRAGAGLITLYVKEEDYALMAALAPAEVMVKAVGSYRECLADRLDALAIGPGLGRAVAAEVTALLKEGETPAVLDADGLNALAAAGLGLMDETIGRPLLLTPHPGEMARLAAGMGWEGLDRPALTRAFARRFPGAVLLLKGARTVIGAAGRPLAFNSTGSPGMATGGMGDVLTGVCAGLMAGGVGAYDAACLGAWLCGRAAELAMELGGESEESLAAADVPRWLGRAFAGLKEAA